MTRVFFVAFMLLGVVRVLNAQPVTPHKYNVLLIMADDFRAEAGCYGGLAKTPNLDALAAAGVRFDRAYCQYPLCNPSRVSMLTGQHPTGTGVIGNRTDFRTAHPQWISLPQLFKENGYVSLRAGKIFHGGIDDPKAWTEGGDAPGAGREEASAAGTYPIFASDAATQPASVPVDPFAGHRFDRGDRQRQMTQAERSDRWLVMEGDGGNIGDNRTASITIDYLNRFKDKPFFIGCGFVKPHSPPTAPQSFYEMYDLAKIPLTPDYATKPTVPPGFPVGSIRPRNADLFIGRESTPDTAREMIRAYLASSSFMDWNVGKVLAELDRLNLRDKTIVIFCGDHGYQLGEKGKWSKAGSLWEQGARVPLTIYVPGARGNGKVCTRTVQLLDLYPTLMELCALPSPPQALDGHSLAPLTQNPTADWNHPAYTVWSEDGRTLTGIAVRTEQWRYAEFTAGQGGAMLIDEAADPHELKNVVDEPANAEVRGKLSDLVKQYRARFQQKG